MGTMSNWPVDDLKIIVKGQKGEPGESGDDIPDNVEIDMDPDEMEDILDGMTDNHSKGQEEADKTDMPDDISDGDIDTNGESIEEEVGSGGKKAKGEADAGDEAGNANGQNTKRGGGDTGNKGAKNAPRDIQVGRPTLTWKQLIKRFVQMAAKPKPEETYNKIHRSSVSGAVVAAQMGGAAVKPGVVIEMDADTKLAFVIDSSGSMSHVIPTVMAEAESMLRHPMFKNSIVTVSKFSSGNEKWKVNFAKNKAAKVNSVDEMPKVWPLDAHKTVFSIHYGGGTEMESGIVTDLKRLIALKYNIVMFTDDNIFWESNWPLFLDVYKTGPRQVFVIFDSATSYQTCKKKLGVASNITHF
jgi:hypothetical protein